MLRSTAGTAVDRHRRRFLKQGLCAAGFAAAGPLVLDLAGCGAAKPRALPPDGVILGLHRRSELADPAEAVREVVSHLDWSWLAPGDSVLVKLASNSGNVHPATTSPAAVRALVAELLARGAGKVLVGDQSGVEYVRLAPGDARFGSTRALMENNGLLAAIESAGGEPHFFDERGFEEGYVEATPPSGSHWRAPLFIARGATEVDHLVYLPRLSSHVLAGYTHGHKLAMGWLRDDSRHHVHHDAASLHEKYTEINYVPAIRDRLRLVVTFAEALMLDYGPDEGTVAAADPLITIASSHLANHDAVSVAALAAVDAVTEPDPDLVLAYGEDANLFNSLFVTYLVPNNTGIPWGPGNEGYTELRWHDYAAGPEADRSLARAYAILGGRPPRIPLSFAGLEPEAGFRERLLAYGGGVLDAAD